MGSLDSRHRIQTEGASPKGLKFSLVITGKSNSLNSLLGLVHGLETSLGPNGDHLCCPRPRAGRQGSQQLCGQSVGLGQRQEVAGQATGPSPASASVGRLGHNQTHGGVIQ